MLIFRATGRFLFYKIHGHKTVLESIRATVQARQRKKLFLQGRPVYPLPTHYSQIWQHLTDYGAYHATLIADLALPGKWQPGEKISYLLVFESELKEGTVLEEYVQRLLAERLSEAIPIPIIDKWAEDLWKIGKKDALLGKLHYSGDCSMGFWLSLLETEWANALARLVSKHEIRI